LRAAILSEALPITPKICGNIKEMIDRNAFERRVQTLGCCLTLARVYRDQDNLKQSKHYLRMAAEYFEELEGVCSGSRYFLERPEVLRD